MLLRIVSLLQKNGERHSSREKTLLPPRRQTERLDRIETERVPQETVAGLVAGRLDVPNRSIQSLWNRTRLEKAPQQQRDETDRQQYPKQEQGRRAISVTRVFFIKCVVYNPSADY